MNNFFATLAAGAKFSGTANDQAVKLFKKQRQSHSHYRSGNVDSKKDGDDEKEEEEDEAGRKGANSNGEDKQSEEEKEEDDEEEDDDESDGDLDLITPGTTKKRKRDNDDKHQAISEKKLQGAQEEEENPFDVLRKKLQIEVHASSSSLSSASSRMEFGGDKNNNDDQSNQSNQRSFILLTKFSELESLLPFPNQQHSIAKVLNKNIEDSQFKVPTPIQMQAIPCLFQGYDVLGCAPTGSGKTGAFMIPLVAQLEKHKQDDNTLKKMGKYKQVYRSGDIYSMVLAPSRELADQLFREFERFSKGRSFRACVLKKSMAGALGLSPKRKHEEQTHQQQHQQHQHGEVQEKKEKKEKKDVTEDLLPYDFVACTPMQLISLMDMGLNLDRVQCLVFDEVDKLFEMGFLQLIDRIVHACTHPSIQKSMWSATVPSEMEEMVSSVLREPIRINVGTRNAGADSIEQKLIFVGEEEGKLTAFRRLMDDGQLIPPCLLFVHSKQRALELLEELKSDNQDLRVDAIHTERKQAHRDEVIRNFREGKTWFLIATDLVSRGVDFKAVHTVVNIDFPDSATSYVHRIGRTGRAGRFGRAITMFSIQDIENLRMIANVMRLSGCDIPEWMLQLKNPSKASVHRPRKHQPLSLARSSPEFVTHKNNSRTEPGKRPKRNGHPKGKGQAQNRGGKETKKERNKKSSKLNSKQKSKQNSKLNQKQKNSD